MFSTAFTPLKLIFHGLKDELEPEWCPRITFSDTRRVKKHERDFEGKEEFIFQLLDQFL